MRQTKIRIESTGKVVAVNTGKPPLTFRRRLKHLWLRFEREWRVFLLNHQVQRHSQPTIEKRPVVLFNASTRLGGFSQNAAFSLLTGWGLQLAGQPIIHFTCKGGMIRCVLGTNPDDISEAPPCRLCIAQSKRLQASAPTEWFSFHPNSKLVEVVAGLGLDELESFQWRVDDPNLSSHGEILPLGEIVLPSLRWALRQHNLDADNPTLSTFRAYIQSAYQVAVSFDLFLTTYHPEVVVVFNGIMFPEAIARRLAKFHGIRVITHEVGFQPFSVFFTEGQATAYPMDIPSSFELTNEQNRCLDDYLSHRFRGDFTMAGIRFWPEMQGLDDNLLRIIKKFKQVIPVFTNVINDTSQVHACSVFAHMFDWLDHLLPVIENHKETLFVIRAHPDEKRRGTRKHSREPVSDWVDKNGLLQLPNVIFIDSNEPLSSYSLIHQAKFVAVYNSSIGLEAALLGKPVLCGGKARYTQYPTVFFPQSPDEYQKMAKEFLSATTIEVPEIFQKNARRVLYWQLYRASIPFDDYLRAHPTPGYVQIKRFSWKDLTTKKSTAMRVLVQGIFNGEPFLFPD